MVFSFFSQITFWFVWSAENRKDINQLGPTAEHTPQQWQKTCSFQVHME